MSGARTQAGVFVGQPLSRDEWRPPLRSLARLAGPALTRLATAVLPADIQAEEARRVAAGVARKINLMPVHVALAILVATVLFALTAGLRFGRRMATLPPADIDRQIESWSRSRLPMLKDVMILYQRLAVFLHHSRC